MSLVKEGGSYYYNPVNGAVYPADPSLARVKGLLAFTAPSTGEFNTGMTLAGAQEKAVATSPPKPVKRTAEQEAAAAEAKTAAQAKVEADRAEAVALQAQQEAEEHQRQADAAANVVVPGTDATVPAVNMKPADFSGE